MLAPDKILHLKGGLIVLLAALAVALVGHQVGVHWLPLLLVVAGLAAGASVEATQLADNRRAAALGQLAPHEVSVADLAASAAPCWAAAVVIELGIRSGMIDLAALLRPLA
jgi:hypothetical protein